MKIDKFFAELKRRNVYKVAAAHAVVIRPPRKFSDFLEFRIGVDILGRQGICEGMTGESSSDVKFEIGDVLFIASLAAKE